MAKKQENTDAIQQLRAAIKAKHVDRLYVFHGEETFLLHHYLQQLRKLLLDDLTEAFNYHRLNSETFDVQSFADSVENLPMMAENTLVWVDDVDIFKLPDTDREKIAQVLSDIPEYCTVVFSYIATPWHPNKQTKLWDAVSKHATVVEFGIQSQSDLIAWVSRHFASQKKRISSDLCSYLIDITGGTMTALAGEISKISAYSGADEIRKSDIDAVTEPVLDAVIYQMTDALGQGECGAALKKLQQLLKMQEEPLGLLGAIGGHFRRMSTAKTLLENGKNTAELMRMYGIKEYPARKAMSAAGRFSARFYEKAAELVLETDRKIKTSADTPQRLLEMLILQLSQEGRNG